MQCFDFLINQKIKIHLISGHTKMNDFSTVFVIIYS